jgi:hypothetical protein
VADLNQQKTINQVPHTGGAEAPPLQNIHIPSIFEMPALWAGCILGWLHYELAAL